MATSEERASACSPFEQSVALAKDGSFSVLGQLLDQYRDHLLGVARRKIGHDLAAKVSPSDVVQETFAQALRGFPKFAGHSEADLRAWLRQMLLNNIRDAQKHWRRAKRQINREAPLAVHAEGNAIAGAIPAPGPTASTAMRRAEDCDRLRKALTKLSADYRQVIEMKSFQERSYEEIGQAMSRTSEAARKLWTRAIDQLAELLVEG